MFLYSNSPVDDFGKASDDDRKNARLQLGRHETYCFLELVGGKLRGTEDLWVKM